MDASEFVTFRSSLFHSRREFAELLGKLRGGPVSARTVEGWEQGRSVKPIPFYLTDVEAVLRAIKPQGAACRVCGAWAVVRKHNQDLCGECAASAVKASLQPR